MDDARHMLEWRNDLRTRAMSRTNTFELSWPDHIAKLEKVLADPRQRLLIVEADGEPAAQCRFDYDEPTEISFTIAPAHRSRGYSQAIAQLMVDSEPGPFTAEIKAVNIASQKLLGRAGMVMERGGDMQLWVIGALGER